MQTLLTFLFILPFSASATAGPRSVGPGVPEFGVREGYRVTLAAEGFTYPPRFLEFDDSGTLYVSQPSPGRIVSLRDDDGDGLYTNLGVFITGYDRVQAMDFVDGWLWFAQSGAIHRGRDLDSDGAADEIETVLPQGSLPSDGGHWFRSLLVTEDSIYTSIGDSGNITDERTTERQKVWRYNLAGGEKTLIASGFRNTEKLVRRPGTNEVWGWDIGSDNFGASLGESGANRPFTDHNPPEEFNRIVEGGFYGHPFIMGNIVPRYEFLEEPDLVTLGAETILPEWTLGAHWTAIGCTFVTANHFPADHKGDCIVACRGSWNSTVKAGYSVERILFDTESDRPYGRLRLVDTLAPDRTTVLARPVDCVEAPDGTILFSCNVTSKVFRISFLGRDSHILVR